MSVVGSFLCLLYRINHGHSFVFSSQVLWGRDVDDIILSREFFLLFYENINTSHILQLYNKVCNF